MSPRIRFISAAIALPMLLSWGVLGGDIAAQAAASAQMTQARLEADRAHAAFKAQLDQSVAEGTPSDLVQPIAHREQATYNREAPTQSFFVDVAAIHAVAARTRTIDAARREVAAVEVQAEVSLNQQLAGALQKIRDDMLAAHDAGVGTADLEQFITDGSAYLATLRLPKDEASKLALAQQKAQALEQATSDAIAATQALSNAKVRAQSNLQRAQADLVTAQAIPVLDLRDASTAITQLAIQLQSAVSLADFQAAGGGLGTQGDSLEYLLYTRTSTFQLLDRARASLAAAQQLNIWTTDATAGLDDSALLLAKAPTTYAIVGVRDKIQGIKNDLDGAIWEKQIGDVAGKILIISVHDQHLKALQDGVLLMESDVATGRPSLPTPVGMYHIMNKRSPYEMVSPWPRGSPYYYNPSWVKYAMEFRDGGYFIHDAPWRTVWGPGANTSNGTHGCINVPLDHMTWIWNWAPVGTALAVVS